MGRKLTQTHLIAILIVSILVLLIVVYVVVKISLKRINSSGDGFHSKNTWERSWNNVHIVLPEFPYGTLSESFVQPESFNQTQEVIEDDEELSTDCKRDHGGTLHINLRYDMTRSVLIVRLIKAESLPKNEENEINYYMVVTLFPQRERLFQSAVYKTSTPQFQECFEFTIPLNDLLLQSLKFTLWTFDCFSPHEVVADAFVRLQRLESYGLSTCREICLAKNLQLEEKVSDVCGEILFSLGYLRLAQRLAVVVIKVTNLTQINNQPPDPFIEVSLLRKDRRIQTQRTSVKKKDQNPHYNETLTFDLPAEYLDDSGLLMSVLTKVNDSSLEETLGKVLLGVDGRGENFDHWQEMRTGTKPKPRWHKLRKYF